LPLFAGLLLGGPGRAARADEVPPAARETLDAYEKELAEVQKKAEEETRKIVEKPAAQLKLLQDRFCKEAKLDEAVAIRDQRRQLQHGVTNALPDPGYVSAQAGDIGKVRYYEVVGNIGGPTWGTDVYTSDSHLAATAVHAGVLRVGEKGIVKVTILPGQDNYP